MQSSNYPHRPLADILQDPDTEWSDIREAIKTQGPTATTNNAIVKVLRESVSRSSLKSSALMCSSFKSSSHIDAAGSSFDDIDGAGDDGDELNQILEGLNGQSSDLICPDDFKEKTAQNRFVGSVIDDVLRGADSQDIGNSSKNPKSCGNVGNSSSIKEVDFTGVMEDKATSCKVTCTTEHKAIEGSKGQKVTGDEQEKAIEGGSLSDDAKIGSEKSDDRHRASPARQLPRGSSKKGGSFRGGGLKNVVEDVEVSINDLEISPDNRSSGGLDREPSHLPHRGIPAGTSNRSFSRRSAKSVAAGDYLLPRQLLRSGSAKSSSFRGLTEDLPPESGGNRLPARRLRRRASITGGSFRGSLKNVMEDAEADMDESSKLEDGRAVQKSGEKSRRSRPSARYLRRRSLDGPMSRRNSEKSIDLFQSDASMSSASLQSELFNGSINLMDFGVDHHKRFYESIVSLGASSNTNSKDDLSHLVDSCGFLGWANNSSSTSSSTSILVDSMGFLGWEKKREENSSQDLSSVASFNTSETDEGEKQEPHSATKQNEKDEASEKLGESWRIEDYEDPNDMKMANPTKRYGTGVLSNQLKRLSTKMTEGISKSSMRNESSGSDVTKQSIKTDDIKRFLLESHSENHSSKNDVDDKHLLKSSFRSFLDSMRTSDLSHTEDECDSRPAIRINREDDIDIGEMRRELLNAMQMEG
mmetsp:Transcript_20287/g.34876  ORF Transcript_20287/g.34876 Transcript_20287/m.34876 type:complete len:699 (-) Transcript_20287:63-2159(-)